MRNHLNPLIMLGLLMILAACGSVDTPLVEETPAVPEATAVTPETSPEAPGNLDSGTVTNEADVEMVQVLLMESMPVQVAVEISGNLPNGCVTIEDVVTVRDGDTFTITLTTQRDIAALCTEALVPFNERVSLDVLGLEAGTYIVEVTGREGTITESFTLAVDNVAIDEPPTTPTAVELPAACIPNDQDTQNGPFVNVQDGYCFQYPAEAGFRIHDVLPPGIAAVWGPPLTPNFEPIRAGLTVYKTEPAGGRSLDEVVATVMATYPEAQVVDTAATFAGEPAQIVEGISGMMDSRRIYLIHDGFIYEITLVPLTQPGEFEEAVMAQRQLLWDTVSGSFTWLPDEFLDQFAACPPMEEGGPFPKSPYVNVPEAYCLLYRSHYGQQDMSAQNRVVFTGPALDPTIPDPLRAIVSIEVIAAEGRTLPQYVDELLAASPDLEVTQSEATLDGEPAIIVSGLPGRSEGRDLFASHQDRIVHMRMEPLGFLEIAEDLEAMWELMMTSFHFVQ